MTDLFQTGWLIPLELLGRQVLTVLPDVLAMLVLIGIGLVAARVLGHFVERVLRVVRFDHLCDRLEINAALLRGGVKADPSYLVGQSIYWAVVSFAVIAGLGALNLHPINQFTNSLLAYIPNVLIAGLILVAGYMLSNFLAQGVLIAGVNAGLPPARLIANMSRWGIQLVALAMAAVGFGITFGGIVFAACLAFGQ